MKVNIKFLSGKTIQLEDVDPTADTIQSIAGKISIVTGFPLTSVSLFSSDGKQALQGNKFLSDYGFGLAKVDNDGGDDDDSSGVVLLLCKRLIMVRTCGSLQLTITPASNQDKMKKSINSGYKKRYDSIKKITFNLESSDYVLDGSSSPKEILNHLYKHIKDSEYSEIEGVKMSAAMKVKMFDKLFTKRLADLSTIQMTFNLDDNDDDGDDDDDDGGKKQPGKIDNEKLFLPIDYNVEKEYSFTIKIDCVNEFPEDTGLKGLPKSLITSIKRQIEDMRICVINAFDLDNTKIHLPQAYHYRLSIKDHSPSLVTLIYPRSLSDSELIEIRRKHHEKLGLPLDRPYIRKANSLKLDGDNYRQRYLINPHLSVPPSGLNGGKVTTVQGNYGYHHYTQDGYNDSGWGCAYRSLQTIISWFMLQGYIEIEKIPTHKEIQEALVACGDKDASFIGKEKWIGSQEVSYVLSQLFNITSKIMFVNSGRELGSKGSELKHHFETNGTPIMIGGGVLAHTIVGIDFDEKSGQLNFLILDPHYTGPEDLPTIIKKGWCNWKTPDFWSPSAFYNLCMPQKPQTF